MTFRVRGRPAAGMECLAQPCHAPTRALADHSLTGPTCEQRNRAAGYGVTVNPTYHRKAPEPMTTTRRPLVSTLTARTSTLDDVVAAATTALDLGAEPCRHCGGTGKLAAKPTVSRLFTAITGLNRGTTPLEQVIRKIDAVPLNRVVEVANERFDGDLTAATSWIMDLVAALKRASK